MVILLYTGDGEGVGAEKGFLMLMDVHVMDPHVLHTKISLCLHHSDVLTYTLKLFSTINVFIIFQLAEENLSPDTKTLCPQH